MSQLWGEFETPEPKDTVPAELIKYIIMQAMQQDPLRSPPPHEKQITKTDSQMEFDTVGLEMDDRVVHSVKLIQYTRDMHDFVNDQAQMVTEFQTGSAVSKPEFPEHPIPPLRHPLNYPLQFIGKDFSDFSDGVGEDLPTISSTTAKNILKKSVAMLVAHSGLEKTHQTVLSTLTDGVEFFMRRIVLLMRISVENGANVGVTGFPDVMERVFMQMGLGSVRGLHDYYQEHVIKRHRDLVEECQVLSVEYANLVPEIKTEMHSFLPKEERDEVPEIHLNDLAGDDGIESANALETGYQMLQSFEQEVRSQQESQEEGIEASGYDGYELNNYKRIKL